MIRIYVTGSEKNRAARKTNERIEIPKRDRSKRETNERREENKEEDRTETRLFLITNGTQGDNARTDYKFYGALGAACPRDRIKEGSRMRFIRGVSGPLRDYGERKRVEWHSA